jgi:outer membrane receptor for ferrienterochelin and colicins
MWLWAVAQAQEEKEGEPIQDDDIIDVVVTGTRTEHELGDSPIATEVLDREAIERSGATNAADLLERGVGVQITRGAFGSSVALQGLDPVHTLILVDGQRLVGRKDGVLDLSRISAERIERIEIVKGPGSTLYGSDAMGGVINIITRDPENTALSADYRGGQVGTFDASASLETRAGPVSSMTTLGMHKQDAYDLDPEVSGTDGVAYDALEASQKLVFDLGRDQDLDMAASYLTRGTMALEEQLTAQFSRNNRVEEMQASLATRRLVGEGGSVRAAAYLTQFRDQFFYDQQLSNREDVYEDSRQTLVEAELEATAVLGSHVATVGTEGFFEWLVSPRLESERGTRQRGAVFVQDEWELVEDKFELLPGMRVDADTQFGWAPTPRLAAACFLGEDVVLRASYGAGFRAPDFKELQLRFANPAAGYVVQGNPDLEPEHSLGGTAGVELDPTFRGERSLHVALQVFRNDLQNLITIAPVEQEGFSATQTFGYVNIARAWTMGVDGSTQLQLLRPLSLRVGGQVLYSRDLDLGTPLTGRAPYSATFGTVITPWRERLTATVDGTWAAARPFYEDIDGDGSLDLQQSEPFTVLDARVALSLGQQTELYVGGENLLSAGDAQYTQLKPLWLYAGFKSRLSVGGAR